MLQLQKRHALDPPQTQAEQHAAFYNCTVPKKSAPAAPLHQTLELQDHISLSSATAPSHINSNWRVSPMMQSSWRKAEAPPPAGHHHHHHHQHAPAESMSREDYTRHQGRVKWYNQQKKYGFIISKDSKELFVHRDDLKPASHIQEPHLITGEYVEYEPTPTQDGRLKAINVSGIQRGPLMCDHGFK